MMKRIALLFLTLIILAVPFAYAQDSWVINKFDSNITIRKDGIVDISENIEVDFGSNEKHGIYRDIPYVYNDTNGVTTYTEISNVLVLSDNIPAQQKIEKNGSSERIRIGNPNSTITGQHTYNIKYSVRGILRSYADHDELYWNSTGNGWDAPIITAKTSVSVPDDKIEKVKCFEGSVGSTDECESDITGTKSAAYKNKQQLYPGEGLTVVAGYTKGMVPILTVKPPKTFKQLITDPVNITVFLLTLILGCVVCIRFWWVHGRDYWFRTTTMLVPESKPELKPVGSKETIVVEFEPPEHLRPAEIGVLMDERADTLDVTATIIDLATRGYLKVTEEQKKWIFGTVDYILIKTDKDTGSLLSYEQLLLKRLFADGNIVNVSALKTTFYDDLADVKKELYKDVITKKLFIESPESVRTKFTITGFIISFFSAFLIFFSISGMIGLLLSFAGGLMITGLIIMILAQSMPRRSAYGREMYRRTKGYYEFISGAEKYRQQFYEKKNLFNEILPYSIVFGLTGKFAKAMEAIGLKPQQTTWYSGSGPLNSMLFATNINNFSRSFSSAIAATPSKGGGFSGGGSSGGGFGGGGGGSW